MSRFYLYLFLLFMLGFEISGQHKELYNENFDKSTTFESTGEWILDNLAVPKSSGYKGASGNYFVGASNASQNLEALTMKLIKTNCKSKNLELIWAAYKDVGFKPRISLEISYDGVKWSQIKFKDVPAKSAWLLIDPIIIENKNESFFLRFTYKGDGTPNYYAIDDVKLLCKT